MIQRDDGPVLLRQSIDCRAEGRRLVSALDQCVGSGAEVGPLRHLGVRITFSAVQTVATGVVGYREDPGRELRARPESAHGAERLEKRLLGSVFGLLAVAQGPQAKVVDGPLVALDEGAECLAAPLEGRR